MSNQVNTNRSQPQHISMAVTGPGLTQTEWNALNLLRRSPRLRVWLEQDRRRGCELSDAMPRRGPRHSHTRMVDAGAPPPPPPPPPAPEAFPTAHVSTPPRPTANIVAPGAPQRPRAALPRYHSLGVSVIPSMMPLEDEESKADEEGDAATLTVEEELAQERAFNAMVAAHTEAEKEREECYKQARRTWVELRKRDGQDFHPTVVCSVTGEPIRKRDVARLLALRMAHDTAAARTSPLSASQSPISERPESERWDDIPLDESQGGGEA